MEVVWKERPFLYDSDWLDAFKLAGFKPINMDREKPSSDLVVFLHSTNGQFSGWPSWEKRGFWAVFMGNEHKDDIHKRMDSRFDLYCSQYPQKKAQALYGSALSVPHALNPNRYFPGGKKDIDVGFVGNPYPVGHARESIAAVFSGSSLKTDIRIGKKAFINAWREWPAFLKRCKATIGTEGVGGCLTSRHMEAVGTHTVNVVYPGDYNGLLPHRITLKTDHSNLNECTELIKDDVARNEIANLARDSAMEKDTHRHRVDSLLEYI